MENFIQNEGVVYHSARAEQDLALALPSNVVEAAGFSGSFRVKSKLANGRSNFVCMFIDARTLTAAPAGMAPFPGFLTRNWKRFVASLLSRAAHIREALPACAGKGVAPRSEANKLTLKANCFINLSLRWQPPIGEAAAR